MPHGAAQLGDEVLGLADFLLDQCGLDLWMRFQDQEVRLQALELLARFAAQRNAPRQRAAHGAHHVQVVGRAVAGEAGAMALPFGHFGDLGAHEVGQREVVEEDAHELLAREAEDEVVLAFAAVAGLAAARATAALALGARDAVALEVFLVAGVHVLAVAAARMAEHRLGDIVARQGHVFALLQFADVAPADRAPHRLLDLPLVAPKEALAVADGLVLAREPAIDDLLQDGHDVFKAPCKTVGGALVRSCARARCSRCPL
ncbi:hypothetical protein D3C72_1310390 [compost metagenome]